MYTKMHAHVILMSRLREAKHLLEVQDYSNQTHPEAVYQVLLDRGIFALHTCNSCGRAHYSPRVLCPFCGSESLGWRESSGLGVVYSTSTIAPRDGEPYVVALIDLDDGPRLMSNVIGIRADRVCIGMRVKVRIEIRNGDAVPLFEVVTA
jgi:uncharacterized OB-fold protein